MAHKNNSTGRHIINGYIRPFSKGGIIPFAVSFVLALIPLVQLLVPAVAYSEPPALRGGGLGKLIILALKMLLVSVLMFAPAIALYLLIQLLGGTLGIGPAWLHYILIGLMLLLAISALIRLPMALAALSRGHDIRQALEGRFVKLLISASFGEYVASLLCLIPYAFLALFASLPQLWLAYILSALLTALIFTYLGYVMNRCYDKAASSLGLPAGPPPAPIGGGRYARTAMSFLLIVSMLAQFTGALAFNEDEAMASGNYPKHQYTAEEYNAALEKYSRNGQLNKNTKLYYDSDTGRFYCAAKPGLNTLAPAAADFIADCLPVIGTVKNTVEFIQYKMIADDPNRSDAERAAAKRLQYLKFFGAAFSIAGPLGKAASGVTAKGVVPFLILKAGKSVTDPTMKILIAATDDAIWGWEMVGNTYKLVKIADKDVGDAWEPYTPEDILGVQSPSPSAAAGTDSKPSPETTQQPGSTAQPDGSVLPDGDYAPFWGTYKGTLVCQQNNFEIEGMTAFFENPEVTITLSEDGYASLSFTLSSEFTFEYYGAKMRGTSTIPVNLTSAYMTKTMAGYMGDYSSSDITATTVTAYSGQMYEDGGGEATSTTGYTASFSVIFDLVRVNGQLQAVADGSVTLRPNGVEESTYLSFTITKPA